MGEFMGSRSESLLGKNLIDMTGQRFGRWTVLHQAPSRPYGDGVHATTMWHCRCDCGNEADVAAASLRNGDSQSCGCLKIERLSKSQDLIGQRFGRWLVIDTAEAIIIGKKQKRKQKMWLCECDCGTIKAVSERSLISGKTISCGCYRKEQHRANAVHEDLTGLQFGAWTALECLGRRYYNHGSALMYRCRCECGNEGIVSASSLKLGDSQSCGCRREIKSYSEQHMCDILNDMGIRYQRNFWFDGLVGIKGKPLSYDFALFDELDSIMCLIECQGQQHEKPVAFFGGEQQFEIQQEHDKRKRQFAEHKGIPLIEISWRKHSRDSIEREFRSQFSALFSF